AVELALAEPVKIVVSQPRLAMNNLSCKPANGIESTASSGSTSVPSSRVQTSLADSAGRPMAWIQVKPLPPRCSARALLQELNQLAGSRSVPDIIHEPDTSGSSHVCWNDCWMEN